MPWSTDEVGIDWYMEYLAKKCKAVLDGITKYEAVIHKIGVARSKIKEAWDGESLCEIYPVSYKIELNNDIKELKRLLKVYEVIKIKMYPKHERIVIWSQDELAIKLENAVSRFF